MKKKCILQDIIYAFMLSFPVIDFRTNAMLYNSIGGAVC